MNEAERNNTVTLLYISYVFIMIASLFSFIYLLIKRKDCKEDEVLASHISWQLKTIIISFVAGILLLFLAVFLEEPLLLFVPTIWALYRVIKGIIKLSENKPPENKPPEKAHDYTIEYKEL